MYIWYRTAWINEQVITISRKSNTYTHIDMSSWLAAGRSGKVRAPSTMRALSWNPGIDPEPGRITLNNYINDSCNMYICMYVCMLIYIYIHTCIYIYMHIYIYIYMWLYIINWRVNAQVQCKTSQSFSESLGDFPWHGLQGIFSSRKVSERESRCAHWNLSALSAPHVEGSLPWICSKR